MFETTALESRKKKGGLRKLLTLPISVGLHALVVGIVVFVNLWAVEFPTNPPAQVAQYAVVAPPPPPPPPPPRKAPPQVKVEIPANVQEMTPTAVPQQVTSMTGVEGGVEGTEDGVEGGVAGGVMGGIVEAPPEPEPEAPRRVGGDVMAPVAISRVPPVYPELARKARISGVVIIEAIIDKQGQVRNARVLKGLPMGLDRAALDALMQWRFRPGTLNGRPIDVIFTLTINFTLTGSGAR